MCWETAAATTSGYWFGLYLWDCSIFTESTKEPKKLTRLEVDRDRLGSGASWSLSAWILGTSHCYVEVSLNQSGVERRYLHCDAAGWNLSACRKVSQLEFNASSNCMHEKYRPWLKLPGAAGRKRFPSHPIFRTLLYELPVRTKSLSLICAICACC